MFWIEGGPNERQLAELPFPAGEASEWIDGEADHGREGAGKEILRSMFRFRFSSASWKSTDRVRSFALDSET